MSLLAATQIPKPADEQAFERASVQLWCALLQDPNVQRNGRRGQRQNGVDLFGIRNGDPSHHVGIQCKLKGHGQVLTIGELQSEVDKALTFRPELREYFLTTTAADDVALQEAARHLVTDLASKGRHLLVYVWGWNTLEEKISQIPAAHKEFDPTYVAFSEQILSKLQDVAVLNSDVSAALGARFSRFEDVLNSVYAAVQLPLSDTTAKSDSFEAIFDAEIDTYRDLLVAGKPNTALSLFQALLSRNEKLASGRILFRIKANIGACRLALGEDAAAAGLFLEAHDHAPAEPKAIANKALGLLLQGRGRELIEFGREGLLADPMNENLAGFLVQGARLDPSIDDPLILLPDGVSKSSEAVLVAKIDFLRRRDRELDWRAAARKFLSSHPENLLAKQFAAEADLDEILRDDAFKQTGLLTTEHRERIESAAAVLTLQWEKVRVSEGPLRSEYSAVCSNLILAYYAVGEIDRALETARQGLKLAPNDLEIARRAALAVIDGRDDALAEQLLSILPAGPDAAILAFRYHSAHNNWAELANLARDYDLHIPTIDRSIILTAAHVAEAKLGHKSNMEENIRSIAEQVVDDPRASIVVADFARAEGFLELSQQAFRRALELIDERSHIASRMMVASHAGRRSEWSVVADLLDGHIEEDHDSDPMRLLASALVNDSPIRRRATRFFGHLRPELQQLPFYLQAEGLLHFNRGAVNEAESALRKLIAIEPNLTGYLALLATLRRDDRSEEIKGVLESIDLAKVIGTASQKMRLAQEMRAVGLGGRALAFGYQVLQGAKNEPDAALGYFGLLMSSPDDDLVPLTEIVGVECWVHLVGQLAENYEFTILDGVDRPGENILSPSHPIANAAIGRKVGDVFFSKSGIGINREWKIAEIKHKYLQALHDIMANFETRFPGAKGLYSVSMKDGDVEPALEQVKRASEKQSEVCGVVPVPPHSDEHDGGTYRRRVDWLC